MMAASNLKQRKPSKPFQSSTPSSPTRPSISSPSTEPLVENGNAGESQLTQPSPAVQLSSTAQQPPISPTSSPPSSSQTKPSTPPADSPTLDFSNVLDWQPWLLILIVFVCAVFLFWAFFVASSVPARQQPAAPAAPLSPIKEAKGCTSSPFNTAAWHSRYEAHPSIEHLVSSIAHFRRRPLAAAILAESEELAASVAQDMANAAYPTSDSCYSNITWAPDSRTLERLTAAQLADVAANSLLLFGVGNRAWTREQTHFIKLAVDSPHIFTSAATGKFASSSRAFFLFYGRVPAPLTSVRALTNLWSDVGRPDIPTLLCATIFAERQQGSGLISLTLVPD